MSETRDHSVLEHLMFHQALVDDEAGIANMRRYLRILDEEEGESLSDPVDESIRSAFELVLSHGMDPWAIDLMEFTRLYTSKIGKERIDLIVAGKLVHMAWQVLRLQSDEIINEKERQDCPFQLWDMDGMVDDLHEEPERLLPPPALLTPTLRRRELRPVSLMELLDAFEAARREVERERTRPVKVKAAVPFRNQAHDEDMERDVEEVWERIQRLGTGPLALRDLFGTDHAANISSFVAVLFLVRNGLLTAWQDELPYGEVFIEIKVDWMQGKVEDTVLAEAEDRLVM